VEPSDRGRLVALFNRLSPESRRRRFLGPKPELTERDLRYLTAVDHHWHEALAAVDRRDGSILGVARYVGHAGRPTAADVAVAVADEVQRQGIGTALTRCLIGRARANGFDALTASTLWENRPARALLKQLGFHARGSEGSVIELELDLWAS
jgi:ribosomal protein S18 acetylase RimI-like enzyme